MESQLTARNSRGGQTCLKQDGTPKAVHRTQNAAIEQCRRFNARPGQDRKVKPYYCPKCHGWHIGRGKQKLSDDQKMRYQILQQLGI